MSDSNNIDFGTYHHNTPEESERTREKISVLFRQAFRYIPDSETSRLKFLDAGSGLGFLSHLICEAFPLSVVYGIDRYEGNSLEGGSSKRAVDNMKALGLESRVKFIQGDLREIPFSNDEFDHAATSLVYHNIFRHRDKSYSELSRVLKKGGILLYGDISFGKDFKRFSSQFEEIDSLSITRDNKTDYRLIVLKKL